MKKEKIKLKEMNEYVNHAKLEIGDIEKVYEIVGDGDKKNDIAFIYLAIRTIKGLKNKGYDTSKLPKDFLNKLNTLSFDDAANLVNIMFFKEDLEMHDIYKAVNTFYNFFNDEMIYNDPRLDAIHGYITSDEDMNNRLYRTIFIIDINMLTFNDDSKFFEYLDKADLSIIYNHFMDNKIKFNEKFNKNLFKAQLSYMKYYLSEKVKTKTK